MQVRLDSKVRWVKLAFYRVLPGMLLLGCSGRPRWRRLSTSAEASCHLRLLMGNDVYLLANLARFKTCISTNKQQFPNVRALLPGEFLSPSTLSALDNGRGMVDVLNHVGLDYACIGNHEGRYTSSPTTSFESVQGTSSTFNC